MGEHIVVLGGGMLGVPAATVLGDSLGDKHTVTLVDQRRDHQFYPNFLWIMTGQRTAKQSQRPLDRLAARGVKVRQDRIIGIDPQAGHVELEQGGRVGYDRLVIGLGLQTHPGAVPGGDQVDSPWELEPAERFHQQVMNFKGGRFVFGIASTPYRCPPAPYETCWLIDDMLRRKGLREATEMTLFSPEPAAFGGGNKTITGWAMNRMAQRGIKMEYGFQVESIDHQRNVVRSKDGREIGFDLLGMVPVHRPAQPLLDSGVAGPGGVEVDLSYLTTKWENVYAGGDCTNVPISKAGGQAHLHAEVIAHNLVHELQGKGRKRDATLYKPHSI